MSYAPYLRNTSGIVFFGEVGGQPTFYSDSNFLIEDGSNGSLRVPNILISNGGTIGSVGDADSITIAEDGDVTLSQNLYITGDLTVNGTTTTVNSTTVTIQDPVIILGQYDPAASGGGPGSIEPGGSGDGTGSAVDDNKDRGIAFNWNINSAGPALGFFGHDDSILGFTYIPSGSIDSNVITGSPGWAVFAGVSGALAGNAATASKWQTARTITLADQMSGSTSIDGSANVTINVTATKDLIADQTSDSTIDRADEFLFYDVAANSLKKVDFDKIITNLEGAGFGSGSMTSFDVSDGTTTIEVNSTETILFSGGTGAELVVTGTTSPIVTVNTVDSEIVHDNLSGFVANEHINHTSVTLTAGEGLTGGGNISASRTFALDFSDLSTSDTSVGTSDLLSIHDGSQKKITFANFQSSIEHDNLSGFVANEHVDHSTVTLTAGLGLSGGGTIAASRTFTLDIAEFTTSTLASGDSFLVLDADGSTHQRATVPQLGSYLAGTNISAGNDGKLSIADSVIEDAIFTSANFVDSSTVDFTVTAGASVTADVITNSISDTLLRDSAGLSVIGRSVNTTGDPADIIAGTDHFVLRRSGTSLGFGLLTNNNISTTADIAFSKLEDGTALSVLGRASNTDGAVASIVASSDGQVLRRSGTSISFGSVPTSSIDVTVASVSSNTTLSADVNLCTANSDITVTLPTVSAGKIIRIKKVDSTGNTVTIQRGGTAQIDGVNTKILYSQYESMTLVSDGSDWFIV